MESALIAGSGLLCVLVVGLVVLLTVVARRRERRRGDRLRGWAQANGWTVTERPAVGWGARLPGGARDGVRVALSGVVRGRPVSVGEYAVTDTQISAGADGATSTTTQTHHYTVAVAVLARLLPDVSVERRGGVSRLARAIAGPGECATGNVAFDRAFRIRTANPEAIPAWCTPLLLDAHLRGVVPAWSLYRGEVLIYRPGRLELDAVNAEAHQVAYLAALLDQC